jgi:hypothetical protein
MLKKASGEQKKTGSRLSHPFFKDLLRWGRLWEVATNFILTKAKFAVACGQFDENFNAG